jgi:hypothetical protein
MTAGIGRGLPSIIVCKKRHFHPVIFFLSRKTTQG